MSNHNQSTSSISETTSEKKQSLADHRMTLAKYLATSHRAFANHIENLDDAHLILEIFQFHKVEIRLLANECLEKQTYQNAQELLAGLASHAATLIANRHASNPDRGGGGTAAPAYAGADPLENRGRGATGDATVAPEGTDPRDAAGESKGSAEPGEAAPALLLVRSDTEVLPGTVINDDEDN